MTETPHFPGTETPHSKRMGRRSVLTTPVWILLVVACGDSEPAGPGGDPPSGVPVSLDFSTCPTTEAPIWLAVQDGVDGEWVRVDPSAAVYETTLTAAKAALAWTTRRMSVAGPDRFETEVFYLTTSEIVALAARPVCADEGSRVSINGTVEGLALQDRAVVSYGGVWGETQRDPAEPPAPLDVSLEDAAAGPGDLISYFRDGSLEGDDDRALIRRDRDIPDGGTFQPIDGSGAEVFVPVMAPINVDGAAGHISYEMRYMTGPGCTPALLYRRSGNQPTLIVFGIPASRQRPTDYHQIDLFVGTNPHRFVVESFHALEERTIDSPPDMPRPTVSRVQGDYQRLRFHFSTIVTLPTVTLIHTGFSRSFSMNASEGYLGGTAVDLSTPAFPSATGFDPGWAPTPAQAANWTMRVSSAPLPGFTTPSQRPEGVPCEDGARGVTAQFQDVL